VKEQDSDLEAEMALGEEEEEEEEEEVEEEKKEQPRHADYKITRGQKQSYILHKEEGKWVLLIAVSEKQSSRHVEIVETMLGHVHQLGPNKQAFVDLRRNLIQQQV